MSGEQFSKRNDQNPSEGMRHDTHIYGNSSAWIRIILALLIATSILSLPSNAAGLSIAAFRLPIEVSALALLGFALNGRNLSFLRLLVTVLAALVLFLKLADIGTGAAFQRPFNPYLDGKMIADGWNLLNGSVGVVKATVLAVLGVLGWLAIIALLHWAMGGFKQVSRPGRLRSAMLASTLLLVGAALLISMPQRAEKFRLQAELGPYLANRMAMVQQSVSDLAGFETELQQDPAAEITDADRLSALGKTDVVLIFIESYGRSAIEDQRYAPRITNRLADVEAEIAKAGLQARSGWLKSPTVGGLSWLAHGTLLSGLLIDNQTRYDRLMVSERPSLNSLFAASGWNTSAVMPAITMDWPEADYFGYRSVHAADGLGYRGKPFNWVTMPDQFTLSAFERLERPPGHQPVMSEIALISSHAPWTPIPTLVDWEVVGDGTIFNAQAESGDPPSVVWAKPERIRAQYLSSVDYVLETLGSYMARYGDNTLFVLVGDHQPAAVVTGENASRDVPMHIVSGNPALLARIAGWDWEPGMTPRSSTPVLPMQDFRMKFLRSFSGSQTGVRP